MSGLKFIGSAAKGLAVFMLVKLLFASPLSAQTGATFVNTLMPAPQKIIVKAGSLALMPDVVVATPGFHDSRLDDAVQRTFRQLKTKTGLDFVSPRAGAAKILLTLDVQGPGESVQSVDEDESYTLDIAADGIAIHSATVVGALRGLTTLKQLTQANSSGYFLPWVHIEDAPRFRWRGLLVDCSRHYVPIPVIERILDGMADVKLNVFHWHLTDDQGFRMESRHFPRLTGMGSDGLFYTPTDAKKIVAYASARGIRVVPEFDMPGHTASWLVGYPELASSAGPYQIERTYGVHDEVMDPGQESTYQFLDVFVGEMAEIFPDPYMHIGGDETNGKQWLANPTIRSFMHAHHLENTVALQGYFNLRLEHILKRHGKTMIGWDEVLAPSLPKSVVVQSWRGMASLAKGAQLGYKGILSSPYYLDSLQPAEAYYLQDLSTNDMSLTAEQRTRILGGEACMWGEHVDAGTIETRIWPSTAAIAERFWSSADIRDVDDMYRRLEAESIRLEALGSTHLTHEAASLRELAATENIDSLRILATTLGPVGYATSQLTPLNRFSDALPPDPPLRHALNVLIREFLQNPEAARTQANALSGIFANWAVNGSGIDEQMASFPLLLTGRPFSRCLPELAAIGSAAVDYLSKGNSAPVGWKRKQLAAIESAERLQTSIKFVILPSLRSLVEAVQEQ